MTDLRTAAQQALEALEKSRVFVTTREKIKHPEGTEWYDGTIAALRDALAQPERVIRGLHSITNEDNGVLTLCFADESSAEAFMAFHTGDADEALIQRTALAQQEQQADYPEEKLQSVAEYISDKYHVWYGVAARDIEEVLRQSVSCGLVSGAPRREAEQEPVAWMLPRTDSIITAATKVYRGVLAEDYTQPLYTHPPLREWVSLTEEDFPSIRDGDTAFRSGALWAERLLKERNT